MTTHAHRLKDIVGYRVVELDRLASGRVIVEFFDGDYYAQALDVQRQIVSDKRRGNAIIDRRYSCECWSTARNPDETGIDEDVEKCLYCGGPNDHGIDCRPASEGGTMPDVEVVR